MSRGGQVFLGMPTAPPGVGRVKFTPGQPIMVTARINDGGSA